MTRTNKILVSIFAMFLSLGLVLSCGYKAAQASDAGQSYDEMDAEESYDGTAIEDDYDDVEAGDSDGAFAADAVPYGSPFCTTLDAGNLPENRGTPQDDLNIYYNFDFFDENRDTLMGSMYAATYSGDFKEKSLEYVEDETLCAPGMDQLRIFFNQATDMETADARGISDVQPYLDMIDGTGTLEEFNEILSSPEFPFSPFLTTVLATYDMSAENIFSLYPDFLIYEFYDGAQYMQDSGEGNNDIFALVGSLTNMGKTMLLGNSLIHMGIPEDSIGAAQKELLDFEKQYGKYAFFNDIIVDTEYGELGQFYDLFTLDELNRKLASFPIKGILSKDGRDNSQFYLIMCSEWLEKLDALWTEENLDTLKTIAKVKVMLELSPYLDSTFAQAVALSEALLAGDENALMNMNNPQINTADRAFSACDNLNTFGQLLAEVYVDNCIGETGKERLNNLAQKLKETYIQMFENTTWLDEDSKEALMMKLETMKFNILKPEKGYFDYSDLHLITSEEGGSLVGNYLILKEYRIEHENAMIGKKAESGFIFNMLKPSTMNCFYAAEGNCINIFPGFINRGFYEENITEEELLGGIGYVIAHEISHAFDNLGSQYDHNGVLNCCFTSETLDTYLELCRRIEEYYNGIYVSGGTYVDGQRVLAEACADLCGMQVIMVCSESYENFDYDKFFERIALDYRDIGSMGSAGLMNMIDTHPLGYLRINVNVQMCDKFYEVFDVQEGDNMYVAPGKRLYIYGK